ncbi:hypothetical protein [Cycloclasticus sp.]|uniref:hypothetical protein n=1 Tax=Cycloclasticus sp. TaxID=2024830 RepID=UPI000C119E80|nr:hypothetical protein [Cycloclasticus sp.]PHR46877.1 MAG: hypothetical protein COA48_11670 [Cycloclasticus sp.]
MSKLLIHIGMEKTGSTTIQSVLSNSRKALAQKAIHFPRISRKSNHNFLASAYIPMTSSRISRGLAKYDREEGKRVVKLFKKDILKAVSKFENTIISGEHLFRLQPAEIKFLHDDLLKAGVSDIRVIGYIRDPVSFYLSFVQQELKGSSRFPSPSSFYIPYADRIQAWQENFDCEFFNFAETRAGEEGLTGHFFSRVEDFFGPHVEMSEASNSILNESLSSEEMQILQHFRKHIFTKSDGKFNDETNRLLKTFLIFRDHRWKKPQLSEGVVEVITIRHSNELDFLVLECGFNADLVPMDSSASTLVLEDCSVTNIVSNFDENLYHELYSRLILTLIRQPFFNLSRSLRSRRLKRGKKR